MITRRDAIRLLGSASAAACLVASEISIAPFASAAAGNADSTPALAPGAPNSPQRIALIEAFQKQSDGLEKKFEARSRHMAELAFVNLANGLVEGF